MTAKLWPCCLATHAGLAPACRASVTLVSRHSLGWSISYPGQFERRGPYPPLILIVMPCLTGCGVHKDMRASELRSSSLALDHSPRPRFQLDLPCNRSLCALFIFSHHTGATDYSNIGFQVNVLPKQRNLFTGPESGEACVLEIVGNLRAP